MMAKQMQQNVRCNVIRQVSDHDQLSLASSQSGKIYCQDVLFDDLDMMQLSKLPAQSRCQIAIQLHSQQFPGSLRKQFSDGSLTRTDLDHGGIGNIAQGLHDAPARAAVRKKILP